MQEKVNAKKKRSRSCISKFGEAVFSAREQRERSKDSGNRTCLLSDALSGSFKRPRESSGIADINQLKREINEERRNDPRSIVTPSAHKPNKDSG